MFLNKSNRFAMKLLTKGLTAVAIAMPMAAPDAVFALETPPLTSPMAPKNLYEHTLKGTAWVIVGNGWGTGWVLDRDKKLMITNHHVVGGANATEVFFPVRENGKVINDPAHYRKNVKPIKGKVIDVDPVRDLALIQLESIPDGVQALPLAKNGAEPGDDVMTVGSLPEGSEGLWGLVDGRVRLVSIHNVNGGRCRTVESTMPTNRGNSGGPIMNNRGELVAVHVAVSTIARAVTLHIDISELQGFLKDAIPQMDPKTAADFLSRANRRASAGKHDEAIADFTEVINRDTKQSEAWFGRGKVLLAKNQNEQALSDFNKAIELKPESFDVRVARGRLSDQLGKSEEALADFAEAARIKATDPTGFNLRGIVFFKAKKFENALVEFEKASTIDPRNTVIRANVADSLSKLGRFSDSMKEIRKIIEINPRNPELFNVLGLTALDAKLPADAVAAFSEAAKLNPQNPIFVFNVGIANQQLGKFGDAIVSFDLALKISPQNTPQFNATNAYFNRGISRKSLKQFATAVDDFTSTIQFDAKNARAFLLRAECLVELNRRQEASADFAKAVELNPELKKEVVIEKPATESEKPLVDTIVTVRKPDPKPSITIEEEPKKITAKKLVNPIFGKWTYSRKVNDQEIFEETTLHEDGVVTTRIRILDCHNVRDIRDSGTFTVDGNKLVLNLKSMGKIESHFDVRGDKARVKFTDTGVTVTYSRVD